MLVGPTDYDPYYNSKNFDCGVPQINGLAHELFATPASLLHASGIQLAFIEQGFGTRPQLVAIIDAGWDTFNDAEMQRLKLDEDEDGRFHLYIKVELLAVDRNYKCQGLGAQLIKAAEERLIDELAARGAHGRVYGTALQPDGASGRYYNNRGFTEARLTVPGRWMFRPLAAAPCRPEGRRHGSLAPGGLMIK